MDVRRIGIYFRGRTIRHVQRWGKDLWIAIRVKDSHELIKVLRDRGFFGRDVEGYLVLPEDTLKEVLGEDLYNKLLGLEEEEEEGTARPTRRQARGYRTQASSARGVSI